MLVLPPGEFFGQVIVDRPLTIVGKGKSTWIGSRSAPTIRITATGVKLQDLMVEVTAGPQEIVIQAEPGSNPILENVIAKGLIVGVSHENVSGDDIDSGRISFLPPPPISAGTSDQQATTSAPTEPSPVETQPATAATKFDLKASWLKFAAAAAAILCVSLAIIFYAQREKAEEIAQVKAAEEAAVLEKARIEKEKLAQEQELAKLKEAERLRTVEKERAEREKQAREQELAKLKEAERLKTAEKERIEKEKHEKEAARLKEIERVRAAEREKTGEVDQSQKKSPDFAQLRLFRQVLGIVQKNYVREVSDKELIEAAIEGLLRSLNPHSSFLTENMFKELQIETKGDFGGAGLEITLDNGILTIVTPIDDTPAYKAGLKPGDKILQIDGVTTKNITLLKAVRQMRGPIGSNVNFTIMREGWPKPKEFSIKREVILVHSVKNELLEQGCPYVKIVNLQERTDSDLVSAINQYGGDEGIKGLILDLRNNPGGLLDQAVKVANLFVDKGLIVYTDGRVKDQRMEFRATRTGKHYKFKTAVLINEGTAAGAEIIAGCLQDQDRASIFGTKSFGNVSINTIIPLENGCGLRLTTAKYYTPKGRDIENTGIIPDVDLTDQVAAQLEAEEREAKLGKKSIGRIAAGGKPDPTKDIVLKKALEWLKSNVGVKAVKANR